MKVCIIGGGVAGLVTGLFLRQKGFEVHIYERGENIGQGGYAFLIRENGLKELEKIGLREEVVKKGQDISELILKDERDNPTREYILRNTICIERADLCSILLNNFPKINIHTNCKFRYFIFKDDIATHACFENGEKITADLYVGADGVNSRVREIIDPTFDLPPIQVKEIVSFANFPHPIKNKTFYKFQHSEGDLAIGFVPMSENKIVWYIQYNANKYIQRDSDTKKFAQELIEDFPEIFRLLFQNTNFKQSYLWNTQHTFKIPKLHTKNVVLIGDAAHPFTTFLSQGVGSALEDASVLHNELTKKSQLAVQLKNYMILRLPTLTDRLLDGMELTKKFLSPSEGNHFIPLSKL